MISPTPEIRRIITDPGDIPQINRIGGFATVRSEYLNITWQLSVDLATNLGTLSCLSFQSTNNVEIITHIHHVGMINETNPEDLYRYLEALIHKYAHRDFITQE